MVLIKILKQYSESILNILLILGSASFLFYFSGFLRVSFYYGTLGVEKSFIDFNNYQLLLYGMSAYLPLFVSFSHFLNLFYLIKKYGKGSKTVSNTNTLTIIIPLLFALLLLAIIITYLFQNQIIISHLYLLGVIDAYFFFLFFHNFIFKFFYSGMDILNNIILISFLLMLYLLYIILYSTIDGFLSAKIDYNSKRFHRYSVFTSKTVYPDVQYVLYSKNFFFFINNEKLLLIPDKEILSLEKQE